MKFNHILFLAIIFSVLGSCLRLDNNLYNQNVVPITSYQRENYTGPVDFIVPEKYKIPDSLVTIFTLQSDDNGDKATVYAEYVGDINRISKDTVIMYCHGNKNHMDYYWQRTKLIANIGGKNHYGVLTLDYRGFGLSNGTPTESGMYADVDAGLAWLKDHGLTNDRLIMYGYSLGTAPAAKLTAEPRSLTPSKLILQSPFASAEVMVQDGSGLALPGSFFTSLKIDVAEKIKHIQQPFLWIHGVNDDFLKIATHGEVVYKNYQGIYKEAHRIEGATHVNIEPTIGYENYLKVMGDFISRK
jgi:pimeloyl-ACP methyl ester carboxylesterase